MRQLSPVEAKVCPTLLSSPIPFPAWPVPRCMPEDLAGYKGCNEHLIKLSKERKKDRKIERKKKRAERKGQKWRDWVLTGATPVWLCDSGQAP